MKTATTIEEQIAILESRGMAITDKEKAAEILGDIGYYRLGFYWFPFEISYPDKKHRNHMFRAGTTFDDVVKLYYFDLDLRNILAPFLYRIEVSLRTRIVYLVSNKYKTQPVWFVDPRVMAKVFVDEFPTLYSSLRHADPIRQHHIKHRNDCYAPAWKTIEFMTLGSVITMYNALRNDPLKESISKHYGVRNVSVFANYLEALRLIRNVCAHGHTLFDLTLRKSIKAGPLDVLSDSPMRNNVVGCLHVIHYILQSISSNRAGDFKREVRELVQRNRDISPFINHLAMF